MVAPVTAECSSRLTRSPGNLRERSSSRRSRGLIDVLAHLGALSRGKRRPRGPGDRVAGSERRRAFTRAPMIAPVPVERPDIRPVPGPLRGAAPPPSTRPARARESLPHPSGAIEPFSPGVAVRGPGAGAGAGGTASTCPPTGTWVRCGRGRGVRGAGSCPNLLQRHSEPGSTARRSAEYQRFSSCASARSGTLQRIWTTCAAAVPESGATGRTATAVGAPPDAERCTSHSKVQFQPSFSRAKCTSRMRSARFDVGASDASAHEHVT